MVGLRANKKKAKDELTKYMELTMSSTYQLLDEDYSHKKKVQNMMIQILFVELFLQWFLIKQLET
jgi:hypothetical protein